VSNGRFRSATGWAPRYPDPWSGWAQIVSSVGPTAGLSGSGESGESGGPSARPGGSAGLGRSAGLGGRRVVVAAALACLALGAAIEGLWATVAPSSFFRSFPGAGRWVAAYPPYNEHLVRDVGSLSLAMAVVTLGALASRRRSVVRVVGAAWLVESVPHLLFHLFNRQGLDATQQAGSLTGLALSVVLALVSLVAAPPVRTYARSQPGAGRRAMAGV
jgi:hypothetical protein